MPLELSSLRKAVTALDAAVHKSADTAFMASQDEVVRNVIVSGVIQHFEFTYELCWKFMKRWLEANVAPAVADGVTRRELFRMAAENRLLESVEKWMRYHDARNQASHTYEPAVARQVYEVARGFLPEARRLLEALEARND